MKLKKMTLQSGFMLIFLALPASFLSATPALKKDCHYAKRYFPEGHAVIMVDKHDRVCTHRDSADYTFFPVADSKGASFVINMDALSPGFPDGSLSPLARLWPKGSVDTLNEKNHRRLKANTLKALLAFQKACQKELSVTDSTVPNGSCAALLECITAFIASYLPADDTLQQQYAYKPHQYPVKTGAIDFVTFIHAFSGERFIKQCVLPKLLSGKLSLLNLQSGKDFFTPIAHYYRNHQGKNSTCYKGAVRLRQALHTKHLAERLYAWRTLQPLTHTTR